MIEKAYPLLNIVEKYLIAETALLFLVITRFLATSAPLGDFTIWRHYTGFGSAVFIKLM